MQSTEILSCFIRIYQSFQVVAILFGYVMLSGCSTTRQNIALPDDIPQSWNVADENTIPPTATKILDLLDDPILESLANEALKNNPDLSATGDRLLAEKALLGVSRSQLWPSIDFGIAGGRSNQNVDTTGKYSAASTYSANIGLSWELDLWGRIRDGYNADQVSFEIQRLEYQAAKDSLIARTIQFWVRAVSLANSIQIHEERVANLEKIQERILVRYRDGIGKIDELSTANTRIFSANADKAEIVEAYSQSIRELELLIGRYPDNLLIPGSTYPDLTLPQLFKPDEVLIHRPDIRISMELVRVAELKQSVAEKGYLPTFLLSGKLLKEDTSISDLMNGTLLWDMILSSVQPIFNAGQIKSRIETSRWQHSAALKELKGAVLNTVGEVRNYWGIEQMLTGKGVHLKSALIEAQKSYVYYETRYLDGLDPLINMLNAKEEKIAIQIQINEFQAARLVNRIDLALALGLGENDER